MPWFEVHTQGEAKSMYRFKADNQDHARKLLMKGEITEAESIEVDGEEIVDIVEYTP